MTTANTIESFLSLINLSHRRQTGSAQADQHCLRLRRGEVIELDPGRHFSVASGQLWLTHRGDPLDHFPSGGDSFDTAQHCKSVIQALADSIIFIQ